MDLIAALLAIGCGGDSLLSRPQKSAAAISGTSELLAQGWHNPGKLSNALLIKENLNEIPLVSLQVEVSGGAAFYGRNPFGVDRRAYV